MRNQLEDQERIHILLGLTANSLLASILNTATMVITRTTFFLDLLLLNTEILLRLNSLWLESLNA